VNFSELFEDLGNTFPIKPRRFCNLSNPVTGEPCKVMECPPVPPITIWLVVSKRRGVTDGQWRLRTALQILVVKVSEATRPLTCKRHKGQKFELNMRRWPVIKYRLGRLVCRERLLNKHDRENPQIPSPPNHQSGSEELGIETHNRSLPAGPDLPAHDWPTSTTGAPNTIRRDLEGSHRAFLGPPPDLETPPERQVRIVPLWADSGEAAIGPL
jgi:hypothetical protein